MATERFFKPGSFYRICDMSGYAVRAERTKKQWNNLLVRKQSFEERQPQDFVRGRRDDQTVPEPRPRQVNSFLGTQTTLTAQSGGGFSGGFSPGFSQDNILPIASTVGFNVGDSISVQLNNGLMFFTSVFAINVAESFIQTTDQLPFPAAAGAPVTDLTSFANV